MFGDLHHIIHMAGIASPSYYAKYPLETIDVAVKGTRNLLNIARQHDELESFLYFSSSEIYGDAREVPTPETYKGNVSCLGPRACYDESKRLGETLCGVYHQQYGVPVRITRPFNVFGLGMSHDDRRVIPMFTYEAIHSRPLPVFRNGMQTRTFCWVSDALEGFLKVMLHGVPGEAYNIGNPNNEISMRDLALLFKELYPFKLTWRLDPYPNTYPQDEPLRRCPDISKAIAHCDYFPRVTLEQGVDNFIRWARAEPSYNA